MLLSLELDSMSSSGVAWSGTVSFGPDVVGSSMCGAFVFGGRWHQYFHRLVCLTVLVCNDVGPICNQFQLRPSITGRYYSGMLLQCLSWSGFHRSSCALVCSIQLLQVPLWVSSCRSPKVLQNLGFVKFIISEQPKAVLACGFDGGGVERGDI